MIAMSKLINLLKLYRFEARFVEIAKRSLKREKVPLKHCMKNVWLVKPAAMNRGQGIEIFDNYSDIIKFIGIQQTSSYWVVQKYLE